MTATEVPFPAMTGFEPCKSGDPDRWFTDAEAEVRARKDECRGCPVLDGCLQYALRHRVSGVWGATTEQDRTNLRRKWGIKAKAMSFGIESTATTARRMAGRGTPVAEIAAHLGLTPEAIHRHLRGMEKPDRSMPTLRTAEREKVACPDCGKTMTRKSLLRHREDTCPKRRVSA